MKSPVKAVIKSTQWNKLKPFTAVLHAHLWLPFFSLKKNYCRYSPLIIFCFDEEVAFKYQRIESISNFAASIDIIKVFYLTVKHIVIKKSNVFGLKQLSPSQDNIFELNDFTYGYR